jgi:hypothetical protein
MRAWILALAACASPSSSPNIVGPYDGPSQRFVVDRITLPLTNAAAIADGDDLDGHGGPDNQLGEDIVALLQLGNNVTTHANDMIASGRIASSLVLQTDTGGDHAGAWFLGDDGDDPVPCGGTFDGGVFASNRTRLTSVPGRAHALLPAIADADPVDLDVQGLEIDLQPDGAGGFDGVVRGGVLAPEVVAAATAGLAQMIDDDPLDHLAAARMFDTSRDGVVTADEVAANSIVAELLRPDIELFHDGTFEPGGPPRCTDGCAPDSMSFALRVHLIPCERGTCIAAPPVDTCHDRAVDGDETDVDCGGSCMPCGTARHCAGPSDCASNACDAGACRAPTCSDGVRDGLESDVDCGSTCGPCATGKACASGGDCMHGCSSCGNGFCGGVGTCLP